MYTTSMVTRSDKLAMIGLSLADLVLEIFCFAAAPSFRGVATLVSKARQAVKDAGSSSPELAKDHSALGKHITDALTIKVKEARQQHLDLGVDVSLLTQAETAVAALISTDAEQDLVVLSAVRDPAGFENYLRTRAAKYRQQIEEQAEPYFDALVRAVAAAYVEIAPWSDSFVVIALKSLLGECTDIKEQLNASQIENRQLFSQILQILQSLTEAIEALSKPSHTERVFFGSRPEVVTGDRYIERDEHEHLNALIADPTQRRTVLVGMSGCGKTQLASALAQQCEDRNWSLVAWLNAESRQSIKIDLVELARELEIKTSDQPTSKTIIRRLFTRMNSAAPSDRLIVFDNVKNIDDLRELVPSGTKLRVIATTTNSTGWDDQGWDAIKVGVFHRDDSINYLLTATESTDRNAADTLARRLGDLPLALAQAAATARNGNLSLARYLDRLDCYRSERVIRPIPGDYYTDDVATALCMAIEDTLENLEDGTKQAARYILGALALLAESGVPTRWLDPTIEQLDDRGLGNANQAADEDVHDALTELIHRSIVQQSADKATTMLHRLQAQVLRESWTEKEHRQACESATNFLAAVNIETLPKNATDTLRRDTLDLIEQLRAVSAQKYSQCLLAESATQNCLFQAFEQAFELGVPQHAVNLSTAVSLFNSIENVEPSDALALQNQLGCAYEAAGDYDTAIRLHSEVLAAYEQMIDIDAGEILISRNNLATAYKANRNIPKAIEILEGTFKEAYQRYGLEHEQTIGSLNNLAETYTQVYEPDIILPMFIVAFELSKKILNPADDISLAIRNNLALTFLKMGDATKAISEFTSLLQDRQRFHLNRHVEHLITLRNLAEAHEANGDMEEAISTLKRAHAEGTELHGDHHLETLWTVNSLGCAYLQDNQFESARHEFESALAKCDEFLDYNHPLTTTIRTNLEYVEQLLATTSESGPTTRRHMD